MARETHVSRRNVMDERIAAAESAEGVKSRSYALPPALVARVNAAVQFARARIDAGDPAADDEFDPLPDTTSELAESALWAEVLRLEKLHNGARGKRSLSRPRKAIPRRAATSPPGAD